jgi:hypothetical protein
MSRARDRDPGVTRPEPDSRASNDRLWCLIDPQETLDEIVDDVTANFAAELAELIRASKADR